MKKQKPLTADILTKLSIQCPFPEVFEDTEPAGNNITRVPRLKIAHIRADHDGYRWWNTVWPSHRELATPEMAREIDATFAALTAADALASLKTLTEYCMSHMDACIGLERRDEFNFYLRGELCDYWLRLITRKGDYNMYLSAYARRESQEGSCQ